MKMSLLQ